MDKLEKVLSSLYRELFGHNHSNSVSTLLNCLANEDIPDDQFIRILDHYNSEEDRSVFRYFSFTSTLSNVDACNISKVFRILNATPVYSDAIRKGNLFSDITLCKEVIEHVIFPILDPNSDNKEIYNTLRRSVTTGSYYNISTKIEDVKFITDLLESDPDNIVSKSILSVIKTSYQNSVEAKRNSYKNSGAPPANESRDSAVYRWVTDLHLRSQSPKYDCAAYIDCLKRIANAFNLEIQRQITEICGNNLDTKPMNACPIFYINPVYTNPASYSSTSKLLFLLPEILEDGLQKFPSLVPYLLTMQRSIPTSSSGYYSSNKTDIDYSMFNSIAKQILELSSMLVVKEPTATPCKAAKPGTPVYLFNDAELLAYNYNGPASPNTNTFERYPDNIYLILNTYYNDSYDLDYLLSGISYYDVSTAYTTTDNEYVTIPQITSKGTKQLSVHFVTVNTPVANYKHISSALYHTDCATIKASELSEENKDKLIMLMFGNRYATKQEAFDASIWQLVRAGIIGYNLLRKIYGFTLPGGISIDEYILRKSADCLPGETTARRRSLTMALDLPLDFIVEHHSNLIKAAIKERVKDGTLPKNIEKLCDSFDLLKK